MNTTIIGPEAGAKLNWIKLTDALIAGHKLPQAKIADVLLERGADKMLSRSAWIDGMGLAVKTATIFPGNRDQGKPALNGSVSLFSDTTGDLEAIIDFKLLTKWKTAGDSLLAARLLARPDSRVVLIVGAGTVGQSMLHAYRSIFPNAQFLIWNRTMAAAARLADEVPGAITTSNLEQAVRGADVIATATMSDAPVIKGKWLRPGTHLDLIGAYTPDMREVDDDTLRRSRIFVDSRATTLAHIGELKIPLEAGTIEFSDIQADFYDIAKGGFTRTDPDEITLCKNGGGAHLDLMTARYILEAARKR